MKELDNNELLKIEGGNPYWAAFAITWAGTFLYEVVNDWEANVDAFWDGYNNAKTIAMENNIQKN